MTLTPDDIRKLHGGGALSDADVEGLPRAEDDDGGPKVVQDHTVDAVIAQLPAASDADSMQPEEKKIKELHEFGTNLGILLWHTDYTSALDPSHERFQMYNQVVLLDDGTLMLAEIKPGCIFQRTLQIDSARPANEISHLVQAIRTHLRTAGELEWIKKPEWYLREGASIEGYRALTENYQPEDEEKVKALLDPEGKSRGWAVFAFDRELILLPDDPRVIFRLRGKHINPVDKSGAYAIDDIPSIIQK